MILPREIDAGAYHFVDGDPVCSECFTRLSRRLRPVSGARAESDAQPIPVNLADLEKEMSKGSQAARGAETTRRERFSSGRLPVAASYRTGQVIFMAVCFALGILLGGIAYRAVPVGRGAPRSAPSPPEKPDGGKREKPPADPEEEEDAGAGRLKPGPDGTITLRPAADAYVHGGEHGGKNFGEEPELKVKKDKPETNRETFLRFDLSGVAGDVSGAHLLLHVASFSKPEGIRHQAALVDDHTWGEKTLRWENRPSAGAGIASWAPSKDAPVRIDVGDEVRAALKGEKNLSMRISAVAEAAGWVNYGSREAEAGKQPALVLITSPKKPDAPARDGPAPKRHADGTWLLEPAADALVGAGEDAGKNYGNHPTLMVARDGKEITYRTYMRFDLSGITGPVASAELRLFTRDRGGSRGMVQQARLVSDSTWKERTVNWGNAPKAGEILGDPWMLSLTARSAAVNVTKAVKAALAGNKQLSIELSPAGGKDAAWVNYHSRESDAGKRPVLVISDKPGKTETPGKPGPDKKPGPGPKPAAGGKAVTLHAIAAAHVTGGRNAEVNKGQRSVLYVLNGLSPDEEREAYIKFDLASVTGTITSAEIRLHPLSVKNSAGVTNQVRLVPDSSWKESTIVWKGKPAAGKAFKTWVPKVGTPVVIDVTEHARKAMSGDRKLSVNLRITGAGKRETWVTYGSRNGDAKWQPELVVVAVKGPQDATR